MAVGSGAGAIPGGGRGTPLACAQGDGAKDRGGRMSSRSTSWAEVDAQGRLVLPPEAAERFGLKPGTRVRLDEDGDRLRVHRPVTHLTKIYIEPTTRCNIDCRMCIRSGWNERLERMREETFTRALEGVRDVAPAPTLVFGGWGEPLFH